MIEEAKTQIYVAPISRLLLSLNALARLRDSRPTLHAIACACDSISDGAFSTESTVAGWRVIGLDIAIGVSIGLVLCLLLGLVCL
jgi:hypothetical protein